ncbi:multisubunit sodium/proton antiporter, MrpB subunit [Halopseudomonas xinjiangensis]|uniref:Multisubunit sodium/proton antiporter, MrpB subunit n=1 Tax=Halopseudomonas xinjiangensis TaxID=487184 RepID=A0A1H1YWA8_9GAMM|nr:hydrogenase subunit MbhD domain-containing protein [Halopseudomonas xinjiangensis]SDT25662.1 multisubunit sodium/proton antiporter, MrpB subunit [Halopseudomonas xinjiangensis]
MFEVDLLFDGTLCLLLTVLAIAAIHARDLYTAVIMFISFGLLLALTWARLGAPDLALAEAAIGAGLTGVLLFSALARCAPERATRTARPRMIAAAVLALAVMAILLQAALPTLEMRSALPALTRYHLPASGVDHPVTAVLLNYRVWDTLLELVVLLLALLGVRQLRPSGEAFPTAWPVLLAWARLLAPLGIVVAGYLLWRGSHAPGGAFQAGALLAACIVVLRLAGMLGPMDWARFPTRVLVCGGVTAFLGVAVITGAWGDGWLVLPASMAGRLILGLEIIATLSIAASLALLVVGEHREMDG